MDYNARLYDPSLGRFLSTDPLIGHPESTQGINPYSYVENNPLNATDPTGECVPGGVGPQNGPCLGLSMSFFATTGSGASTQGQDRIASTGGEGIGGIDWNVGFDSKGDMTISASNGPGNITDPKVLNRPIGTTGANSTGNTNINDSTSLNNQDPPPPSGNNTSATPSDPPPSMPAATQSTQDKKGVLLCTMANYIGPPQMNSVAHEEISNAVIGIVSLAETWLWRGGGDALYQAKVAADFASALGNAALSNTVNDGIHDIQYYEVMGGHMMGPDEPSLINWSKRQVEWKYFGAGPPGLNAPTASLMQIQCNYYIYESRRSAQ